MKQKQKRIIVSTCLLALMPFLLLCGCGSKAEKTKVNVLIVPKFEIGIMNAAECFGLKDRIVSLRVIVNMDTFLEGESPEKLWLEGTYFSEQVKEENSETVDIFGPGMENLFDVGQIVIDATLAGEL